MSISVICPSCGEENPGSVLLCTKCQKSLIGVPRQERPDPEVNNTIQQSTLEAGNVEKPNQENNVSANNYGTMFHEIRSWGLWSLGLGALHLFTAGFLSAPWGILLIIVGLASFYFRSASMFVIYTVTLGWAALSNLISFEAGWGFFAIYQFYLAFRVFQQYRSFRNLEGEYSPNPDELQSNRASRMFPWLGSLFGCSSIIGFVLIVLIVFIVAIGSEGTATVPEYFGFIEGLAVNFGILGASIGLASLLSKYNRKVLAIIGLVSGIFTVLLEFSLLFLL